MSKDACCHGDYTAHVTEEGKTITHTGGSVEVFHSYQLRQDIEHKWCGSGREEKQDIYDIKANFIIFLTYLD